ncbi:MAG: plasmid pRiA4b ORF-3 family protein [Acidobacteria bacterium]|nr:plasmid pRiA4b ORF-3 family protein [Acidobacteriota bacterium]
MALREVEPPIWRRVLVRDTTTLAKLHAIIQDVMGWQNYHLYQFTVGDDEFEAPDPEATGDDATQTKLKDLQLRPGDSFGYLYDFGDDWQHVVTVEEYLRADPEQSYPYCTGGARNCPPEDSGGPHRYAEVLQILQNPEDPEYAELADWLGDGFHPEAFDVRTTNRILMLAFQRGAV